SAAHGQADLPDDQHRAVRHPQGGAAAREGRAAKGLAPAQGAVPAEPRRGHGAAARQAQADAQQQGVPRLDAFDGVADSEGGFAAPPSEGATPPRTPRPTVVARRSARSSAPPPNNRIARAKPALERLGHGHSDGGRSSDARSQRARSVAASYTV